MLRGKVLATLHCVPINDWALDCMQVSSMLHIKRWKVQEYHRIAMKSLRSSDSLAHLAHAL